MADTHAIMTVRNLGIDDVRPGMFVSYDTVLGNAEVEAFAHLTGDVSPLHVSGEYGRSTPFGTNLIHGMLIGGHFSTIVGVLLPGRRALLNGIRLNFLRPIPVESTVTISAKVRAVSHSASALTLDLVALRLGEICVTGQATVAVRG